MKNVLDSNFIVTHNTNCYYNFSQRKYCNSELWYIYCDKCPIKILGLLFVTNVATTVHDTNIAATFNNIDIASTVDDKDIATTENNASVFTTNQDTKIATIVNDTYFVTCQ